MSTVSATATVAPTLADAQLNALPHPVIMIARDGKIADANVAAEQFFEASIPMLRAVRRYCPAHFHTSPNIRLWSARRKASSSTSRLRSLRNYLIGTSAIAPSTGPPLRSHGSSRRCCR